MIPRKHTIFALGAAALLLLAAASTDAAPTTVRPACPVANGTYDSTKDYFPDKAAPVFATYWNITYFNNYKLLTNTFTSEIMVLTMCNTPRPNITSAVKYFTVPINLAAVASLSVSRFFERLELRERIRYVPAISTVTSPCLQTLVQQGFTRPFPANATLATLSDVDAVFSTGGDDQVSLLTNLNITVLFRPIAENAGPIARFEWIKYLSAFFNAEGTANTVFESARTLYQCNSGRVASQSKKTAAWLKPNTQNFTFVTTDPVYKNEMLADAGITPVTTSSSTGDVAFWSSVSNADVLIDDSAATSWSSLLTGYGLSESPSATSNIKWVQERQVYQMNRLRDFDAYDDFTQSYLAMPEYIQSDIISIVYPTYNKDWKYIWARNVYNEDEYTNLIPAECFQNDTASAFYLSWKQNVTCPDLPATSSAPAAATEGTAATPSATAPAPAPAAATTTSTTAAGSSQAGSSNSTGGSSTGTTAGAAIGGILVVGIVGGAAAFFFYRRRRSQGQDYLTRRQQMFAAGQIPGTDGSAVMVGEDTPPADVAGEWAGQGATGGSGVPRGEWVQMDSVEPAALNVVVSDGRQGR